MNLLNFERLAFFREFIRFLAAHGLNLVIVPAQLGVDDGSIHRRVGAKVRFVEQLVILDRFVELLLAIVQLRKRADEFQVLRIILQPPLVFPNQTFRRGLLLGSAVFLFQQNRLGFIFQHRTIIRLAGRDLVVAALGHRHPSRHVFRELQHLKILRVCLGQLGDHLIRLGEFPNVHQCVAVLDRAPLVARLLFHHEFPREQRRLVKLRERGRLAEQLVPHDAVGILVENLFGHLDRLDWVLAQGQLPLRQ